MTVMTNATNSVFNLASFNQTPARELARFNMIEQQIRTWDVLDPSVLQGLSTLPREDFIPNSYIGLAFADIEVPIGEGQTMLSPKIEGRFLQALQLRSMDRVLQIGAGSAYFSALMSQFCQHVTALEIDGELCKLAKANLKKHNIENVTVHKADGIKGLPKEAPFDVIVLCGSCPVEPKHLREQLAIGGRMLVVLGKPPVMQATLVQRKSQDSYKLDVIFETQLTELLNAPQAVNFIF